MFQLSLHMCGGEGGRTGIGGGHGAAPGPPGAGRVEGRCEAGDAGRGLAAHATAQGAPGDVQLGASLEEVRSRNRSQSIFLP